jgi:pimeloyl-ACP methyl ester carboxylesterase
VIVSPEDYAAHAGATPVPHATARRRNHWSSAEEMFARFAERSPFSAWDPAVLRDYCRHGLLPSPTGEGLVLACPPEFEAAVYATSRANAGVHESLRRLTLPVLVVRAQEPQPGGSRADFRVSPTWPGLVRQLARGREIHFPEKTHFLPMEEPGLAAELILRPID